ncbi:MAG TPA: hypothetical protein DCP25_10435 [Chloroflexi bacterium]|nr:hypothetical protein [Chloroflexota bacterium]
MTVVLDGTVATRTSAIAVESGDHVATVTLSTCGSVARSVQLSGSEIAVAWLGRSLGGKRTELTLDRTAGAHQNGVVIKSTKRRAHLRANRAAT